MDNNSESTTARETPGSGSGGGENDASDGRSCARCGCHLKFIFDVPGAVWVAVVPRLLRHARICFGCFDHFAAKAQVTYAQALRGLQFLGEKAAFEFDVNSAVDY